MILGRQLHHQLLPGPLYRRRARSPLRVAWPLGHLPGWRL